MNVILNWTPSTQTFSKQGVVPDTLQFGRLAAWAWGAAEKTSIRAVTVIIAMRMRVVFWEWVIFVLSALEVVLNTWVVRTSFKSMSIGSWYEESNPVRMPDLPGSSRALQPIVWRDSVFFHALRRLDSETVVQFSV